MDIKTLESREKVRLLSVVIMTLLVLSLFLVVNIFSSVKQYQHIGWVEAQPAQLTFSGRGEVVIVPDVAEFTFTVQLEDDQVDQLQSRVAERVNEIVDYLKSEGVAETDIRTVNYSVFPRYEFRPSSDIRTPSERVQIGFEAIEETRVIVKDMDRAGELVGGVGRLGATGVSGVSFSVEDIDAIRQQARREAIADAKGKAEELAGDLGVRLVRIVGFGDYGTPFYHNVGFRGAVEMAPDSADIAQPDFSVGEENVVVQVDITYEVR